MNKFLFFVFAAVSFMNVSAQAQSVPLPQLQTLNLCRQSAEYWPADRAAIKKLFSETITPLLARMKEISYLGSMDSSIVSLGLHFHRVAFELEFQAEVDEILRLGATPGIPLHPVSRRYIAQTLSGSNLGFSGLTLLGETQSEAEQNSLHANTVVTNALTTIWKAF